MILIHKLTSLKFKTDGAIYHSKVVIIYERRRIERWFLEDVTYVHRNALCMDIPWLE